MMGENIMIYGAGGAGRELAFALSLQKEMPLWNVLGFIDDTPELKGKSVNDLPVLGDFGWLKQNSGNIALCIVNDPKVKRHLVEKIKQIPHIKFPRVISRYSLVSKFIEWGEGCIVAHPFNYITTNIKIGNFVWINSHNLIGHDTIIGDYTTIFSDIDIGGGTEIGSDCVIGSGVTILPKIKIGDGSIIGGGSLVSKDIPAKVVATGVPAKITRELK
jgi:sugar O-acyltransferase (sialic acid O-acetyltransferase NeuD family)